jgi:hypothetical protein
MVEQHQNKFECDRWYQNRLLGSIEKSFKAFEGDEHSRQMASNKLIPSTMTMVEPKAKKKYKTKKEKENDDVVKKLMIVVQTMVGEELLDEEAQSLRDLEEEVAKPLP